jgi:hypothetical protein
MTRSPDDGDCVTRHPGVVVEAMRTQTAGAGHRRMNFGARAKLAEKLRE